MRRIDADKLKARLSQTLLDDLVLADVLNIIEDLEKDPEDRTSEMLDTYARGYNDGVKMTIYLMLKFKDAATDQEQEHER